jgi:hypothetical protein
MIVCLVLVDITKLLSCLPTRTYVLISNVMVPLCIYRVARSLVRMELHLSVVWARDVRVWPCRFIREDRRVAGLLQALVR